jgi:erythromycin esterase
VTQDAVVRWIGLRAHPLATLDPRAPLTDLRPLAWRAAPATVVGLGGSTRLARELSLVKHRALRVLVEELGFRSLALEADRALGEALDGYVRGGGDSGGSGELDSLLADAQPFWRTEEIADVLRWMRRHNERHPTDLLRVVGVDPPVERPLENMAALERGLADNLIAWQEDTGQGVAYWGGSGHTADGTTSTAEAPVVRRAGSYLRERYGAGYLSVGFTFDHGAAPYPIPAPSASLVDAVLGQIGLAGYLLDLHAAAPGPVRAWLDAPAKARLIGPRYDPEDDAAFHMAGGSLAEWFDVIVHWQEVTPVRPLGSRVPD